MTVPSSTLPAYANRQPTFPEMYERVLVEPLFRPWAERLLDQGISGGETNLLDIACGTGIVARLAKRRLGPGARVVAADLSGDMIALARTIDPAVEWIEADATALPAAASGPFDAITCQQGFQFFADRPAVARELHRVIRPEGHLAVAVWRSLEDNPFFLETHRIGERHAGPIRDQRHGFSDPAELAAVLRDAGFSSVRVDRSALTLRFPDPVPFLRMNAMALVGMSAASPTLAAEERARLVAAIAEDSTTAARSFCDAQGLVFETTANLALARG